MLLELLLSVCLHVTGHARYSSLFIYIADFGYYAGGNFTLTWNNITEGGAFDVQLVLFNHRDYRRWYDNLFPYETYVRCPEDCEGVFCWRTNLTSSDQSNSTIVPSKDVYVAIIQHCKPRPRTGEYSVDAHFWNPNGQCLDTRDIPSLTVLPIMIPLFGVLFLAWVAISLIRCRKFLMIHFCFVLILIVYILYLVINEVALWRGQTSDDYNGWWIGLIVVDCVYDVILFSTLIIASSGWCLLHVQLTAWHFLHSIGSAIVFVAMTAIQNYVDLGLWMILTFIIQIAAIVWALRNIRVNTEEATHQVTAHLLVITNSGINPTTTPIYNKLQLYQFLLWALAAAVLVFLVLNFLFALLSAVNWVIGLGNNILQFIILTVVLFLYRPRGKKIDQYMQTDEEIEGVGRDEVLLDDLDSFSMATDRTGLRQWDDEMQLPPEPIVISSRDPSRVLRPRRPPLSGGYTAMDEG
jgi:hypothetical protein